MTTDFVPSPHKIKFKNNIDTSDIDSILLFLRHGVRLDQVPNEKIEWTDRKERFYDTPLSEYKLPAQIASNILNDEKLAHFNPSKMIISPYRRCIETAAIAANVFGVHHFVIDARIGEISHDPTSGNSLLPKDAHYIPFDEMKQLILGHLDEDKIDKKKVEIVWDHKEKLMLEF